MPGQTTVKRADPVKRWMMALLLIVLGLLADVASGPYRTMHAISHALKTQDAGALADEVDFPALRASLEAQLDERVLRRAGPDVQSNLIGAIGIRLAQRATGFAVDAMVTPLGLSAIIEGRKEWGFARNGFEAPQPAEGTADPLRGASCRFVSPSRFTATMHDNSGHATILVLTRSGLRWRLSDIQLPP